MKHLKYKDFTTREADLDRQITTVHFTYSRGGFEIVIAPSMEGFDVRLYKLKHPTYLETHSTGFQKMIAPAYAYMAALNIAQQLYSKHIAPKTITLLDD